MKKFQPFVMERMMSRFEKDVDYNLSESGVHPILLRELLAGDSLMLEKLLDTDLNYPHANGIPLLRQNISRMYDGAKPDNVLVTVGAIEANYIILQTLLSEKDEIIVMLPNYMQIWGIAKNHGYHLKTFRLIEERNWSPDLDELESLLTPKTKLIAVCNPDNPTGRILTEKEMDGIISCAGKVNA
jgi:aspartate/methionine/tyrosine aminotransferase